MRSSDPIVGREGPRPNRDFTPTERQQVEDNLSRIKALDAHLEAARASDDLYRVIANSGQAGDDDGLVYSDWTARGRRRMARDIVPAMRQHDSKALLPAGEVAVGIPVLVDPVRQNAPVPSLLAALPSAVAAGGIGRYLVAGPRVNNADVVPVGGLKPTSPMTLTPADVKLSVVAHVSEQLDRFALEDASSLTSFVSEELIFGVQLKISQLVVADILGASGLVNTAFSGDILATARKAIQTAEELGVDSAGLLFVLSPGDWSTAEQSKATPGGQYLMSTASGAVPVDSATRRLWGTPVVTALGLPTKVGLLLDRTSLVVYSDGRGVRVDWGQPADSFLRNQVVGRAEARTDTAILRPSNQQKLGTAA